MGQNGRTSKTVFHSYIIFYKVIFAASKKISNSTLSNDWETNTVAKELIIKEEFFPLLTPVCSTILYITSEDFHPCLLATYDFNLQHTQDRDANRIDC